MAMPRWAKAACRACRRSGTSLLEPWEIGCFLTRLHHHKDRRALLLCPRVQTVQRLQDEVEGLLVRLRFDTRCCELVRHEAEPHAVQTAHGGDARPLRPDETQESAVPAHERVEGVKGMVQAHRLEGLPDPIILPAACLPPAVKELRILEGIRQRQADEHHPGVECALKGLIDAQILLRTSIDESQIEHALGRQPLREERWPGLRVLYPVAKGHAITYHHQLRRWGPGGGVAKAMAIGLIHGLNIGSREDTRLKRLFQHPDRGMAAATSVRCAEARLLEIRRQQTGRAHAQGAFTTRHGEHDHAKEEPRAAQEGSYGRPASRVHARRSARGSRTMVHRWCAQGRAATRPAERATQRPRLLLQVDVM